MNSSWRRREERDFGVCFRSIVLQEPRKNKRRCSDFKRTADCYSIQPLSDLTFIRNYCIISEQCGSFILLRGGATEGDVRRRFGVLVVPLAAWVLSKGNPRAWSTLLLTNMSSNNSFSNAATFVGRYISFLNKTEKATNKALVIAYIISRNEENMSWNVMMKRKNLWCSGRNN